MTIDLAPYNELHRRIQECTYCQHFSGFGWHKFKPDKHGDPKSNIWIVGTDPREIVGEPNASFWRGASKQNLREPIEEATGKRLEEVAYLTDVVKCQRKGKSLNRMVCKNCVRRWFRRELIVLKPKYILALGPVAHQAVKQFAGPLSKRGTLETKFMLHPSPANANNVAKAYPLQGWNAYKTELKQLLVRWLDPC